MATGYKFEPLDRTRQEIRLLCFEAAAGSLNGEFRGQGQLECTIKHVSTLDDLPEYYAISYTWGDSPKRGTILIDDNVVTIPHNAEVALKQLLETKRLEHEKAPPLLLESPVLAESPSEDVPLGELQWPRTEIRFWIDSICINQSDAEEKSWQLLLISDIFSQAQESLLWLGEDTNGTAKSAMRSINCVVDRCKDETNNLDELFDTVWALSPKELSPRSSAAPLPLDADILALRTFYSSPWFQRLWVLQESVLSTRPICHKGSCSISFFDVTLAARWIWYRTFGRLYPGDNQHTNHTIGIQNAATMWDMISTPFIVPRVLSNLLLLGTRFETSDPRDHVYAILGLLNDDDFDCLTGDLLPDYSIPLAGLYARVTRSVIQDTKSLFILKIGSTLVPKHEERNDDALDAPSWVPRYDWIYDVNQGSPCAIKRTGKGACGGSEIRLRTLKGLPSVLTVQGMLLDRIDHLASPWEPVKYGTEALKSQIIETWNMTTKYASKEHCGELEIAFATTICAGRNKFLQETSGDANFYAGCAAFFWSCGPPCKSLSEFFWFFHRKNGSLSTDDSEEIIKAMTQNSRNLRLFVSAEGRLGLAPPRAESNDVICLIPGCDVPVVLRKQGVFWRYVGDAYMYGTMDGGWFDNQLIGGRVEPKSMWFNIE